MSTIEHRPAVEDTAWVLRMYEEAKELFADIRVDLQSGNATLERDLAQRVEDFHNETFMDRCTTLGLDCGCNTATASGEATTDA